MVTHPPSPSTHHPLLQFTVVKAGRNVEHCSFYLPQVVSDFALKSDVLLDEVRAGGRINLIIGRGLVAKARESLGLPASTLFRTPAVPEDTGKVVGALHHACFCCFCATRHS